MSLRSVNLNHLPVLRALLQERNLSRAAESVGLTQPAVSNVLTRLREVLNDPLLVREGRGMALTLRAQQLIEPVEKVCTALEDLLETERFNPAKTERRFIIASADYAVVTIAPALIRRLEQIAPHVSLHFVDIPHISLEPHAGEVDFFIVPDMLFQDGRHPALVNTTLVQDEFVTVVSAEHPLASMTEPSREDLLAQRYAMYYPALAPVDATVLSAISGQNQQGRNTFVQVQQFSLLPALAFETNCAAVVPRRIAEYMGKFIPIKIIDEGPLPLQLDLSLAWYSSKERDPAHKWFRNVVLDHCQQLRSN